MSTYENVGTHLTSAAREAWTSATSAIERLASSITGSQASESLQRAVRPRLAALRWSSFGQSTVVPFPAPSMDDPRMLLTLLSLARVLYDEVEEHRNHQLLSPTGTPDVALGLPLPPVTTALAAAAVWRYLNPTLLREVCLSPYCILERNEPGRLWMSCLTHLDVTHLLSNLTALLPDAAALERRSGSGPFVVEVALLSALSSGLFVGWAVFEKEVLDKPNTYYAVGAVGLSSLAFALQVVRGESRRGSHVALLGVPLPAQFAWVVQLGLTHLTTPDTSFAGHVCGVLAGIAHVYMVKPLLRTWLGLGPTSAAASQPRFYGSGTLSGRPLSSSRSAGARGGLRRSLQDALTQLALAACTVAVYALASQRRQRQPLSNWRLRA